MVYAAQKQQSLFIDSDDYALENNPDIIFTKILNRFDFRLFHEEEKLYYEALADFNKKLAEKRKEKEQGNNTTNEPAGTKDDAYQGLLFQYINNEHPNQKTILFEIPSVDMENLDIDEILRNHKGAGRKPKDFYSLVNLWSDPLAFPPREIKSF